MRSKLLEGLLGRQKAAVLSVVLARSQADFYQREVAQLTGLRLQQVQRALNALAELGILLAERRGNRVYYRLDPTCPVQDELRSLVVKTSGLADMIRDALATVKGIRLAFIFGSMVKGTADAGSDVDLLVVAEARFADIVAALLPAQRRLKREITPTVYSPEEFAEKARGKHSFLAKVLREPRILLVGDADEVERMGRPAPR